MTLQRVLWEIAQTEIPRVFPIIPVFVRLGEFYVGERVGPSDVREYVRRSVPPEIGRRLEALERARRLVVVFDGMDEMSRRHYAEHTEALSLFAGEVAAADIGGNKTLFSCRITDFSPKFLHRRLVLLPFDLSQIKEYLRTYIKDFPIVINGKPWTLNRLARQLADGELPMEAGNPFVLWLFCFQVSRTGAWPASRVDLLRFYIEQTYEDKASEAIEEGHPLPELGHVLDELGAWPSRSPRGTSARPSRPTSSWPRAGGLMPAMCC